MSSNTSIPGSIAYLSLKGIFWKYHKQLQITKDNIYGGDNEKYTTKSMLIKYTCFLCSQDVIERNKYRQLIMMML